jgi:Flp pilus assembly protein protease CpaA
LMAVVGAILGPNFMTFSMILMVMGVFLLLGGLFLLSHQLSQNYMPWPLK